MLFGHEVEDIIQTAQTRSPALVQRIHELAGQGDGEGHLFLFPLTSAAAHYEFFKGVLRKIAPKARALTLVTPSARTSSGTHLDPEEKNNLAAHLNNVLKKRTVDTVHIIDRIDSGKTIERIRETLNQIGYSGKMKPAEEERKAYQTLYGKVETPLVVGFMPENPADPDVITLGWKKDPEGKNAQWGRDADRRQRRALALDRRYYYNLGIAFAKEYLKTRKRET